MVRLSTDPDVRPGKMARDLDPHLEPWEQQRDETKAAFEAFLSYKTSTDRVAKDHAKNWKQWSAEWSWAYRAYRWDLHVAAKEDEKLVRYRIEMNERHRTISRAMVGKVAMFVKDLDPKTLSPGTASRMFELAVRIEREAAGAGLAEPARTGIDPHEAPSVTLGEMLDAHSDVVEADLALELHKILAELPSSNGSTNGSRPK